MTTWKKCRGSLRPGLRGTFGRVVCPVCGARLKPMAGNRMPNHKALHPRGTQQST